MAMVRLLPWSRVIYSTDTTPVPVEPPALLAPSKPKRVTVQLQDKFAPSTPAPQSRRTSEAFPLAASQRNFNRREMSPSPAPSHRKSQAQVQVMRRDSSVCRPDARRPSLPATVFENRALPGQPAFLVPSPASAAAAAAAAAETDAPPAVPVLPPMFYATYRRGSNGEVLDPALIPHGVQAQKSLYYRTKPCRYWSTEGACPKGDKCTFIHDPSIAPSGSTPERCLTPTPAPVVMEEPVVVLQEPRKSLAAVRPRLPAPVASKVREPHPAWRVVGGGVTLANFKTEDQMDEDAVEQELLGLPAAPTPQPQPQQLAPAPGPSSPTGYEAHNGYPAYALPTHAVYHAYAYPSPVAYQAPATPQPVPVQYVPAGPGSPGGAYPGAEPAWGGWTMVEGAQPMPYYAVPMYSPPPQQQSATPVLYGTTPSAYVYGVPADTRTVDVLAGAGIDVSALDGSAPTFLPASYDHDDGMTDLDELEGYGMTDAFSGEVDVQVGTIGTGMVSSVPPPAEMRRSFSWADEVEEMDPQWSVAPASVEVEMADSHHHHEGESGSWPQCATTPNSPRLRARLFSAEA
ncbi:hypothetical protein BKA62DRAFT_95697 [Auriculariales sp. MPI-PUGE-AT-0066]|nr:hypothetical protein BKA62DRAFT_95697 [Auriculariales sp. MPI-PUGE-AT-0066]